MKINSVIVKPLLTEKSLNKTQSNFYTFKVALKSNKNLISNEIKNPKNKNPKKLILWF